MELKIIKEEKDTMEVELVGESHTFVNLLKEELYEDPKVKSAAYLVAHPLTDNPKILVRVTSGRTPAAALKAAAQRIQKKADELEDAFKKAAK